MTKKREHNEYINQKSLSFIEDRRQSKVIINSIKQEVKSKRRQRRTLDSTATIIREDDTILEEEDTFTNLWTRPVLDTDVSQFWHFSRDTKN